MSTYPSSHSRTIVACFISCLMILGQLAPLAAAAPRQSTRPTDTRSSSKTKFSSLPAPVPPAPFVPNISATKVDSFPDPNIDGKADPGETITYTTTITNSGTDASGVQLTDTIDANTTLVPGSLKISPLAFDDTYVAAQNTPLSAGAPGVLTNDTGTPAPTAVPIVAGPTTQGGTVTLNADGSFLYNPAAAFVGVDTFTYTATNSQAPNNTATVTINVDAPPSVTATTPTNGATNQSPSTNITITFSEPVNVTGDWFQISCTSSGTRNVADTVVSGGPTTFTINPNVDFTAPETCTVTVFAAQVSDQDANDPPDNMAANFVFSFGTSAVELAPTVSSTTPTNGATSQATNSNIDVTFSEPVNVSGNWFQVVCATSGTRNVADTVVTGGPTSFTINPNVDFAAGETCTVTVFAAQVTDQDANDPPDNMAANFVFSFSTDAFPAVNATTPTNGATQIPNNTNVTITFSEPVDVTGNWFQLVGATSGTRNVADTVVTGGPTTFTINPNVDFTTGESITVTVFAAQVSDQDTGDPPQNMAANFVFSFNIDQAPSVTATTPTNGATNQALNSNVSITFSEPVNVAGNWFQISCANSGTRNVADTVVTGGPTTFTINPNPDFTPNEVCTTTVAASQVTDQDSGDPPDNMAANFVFSFTTIDIAPTVTSTTPSNGAVNQTTNTNLSVTFSEPVNVTGNWFQVICTSSGTRNVADTIVTGGPTTFTINPNVDFTQSETCTTTVFAAQVTDQDSNDPPDNMAANFVFSFTLDAAPSVSSTTPTNGATQQANNTNVSITFNEPVNVTGNWFQLVGATSGTRNVADTVVTGGPTTFTINPNTDFANGELVTVTAFAAQVTDQDSNDPPDNMAANFVFSFTIDSPPSVTTTVPTNGAIDVLKSANLVVNFSENVNATTSSFTIECPAPGNVQPFAISGSGTNQITLNPTSDLPSGVLCTVTVLANQITDTDSGDPPDNMTANHVFSFGVEPDAVNDNVQTTTGQTVIGNVSFNTANIPYSTTSNDISVNPFTITAFDAASVNGGTVSMITSGAGLGQFTYNPPRGFEGTDTFNYTISNANGSDTATVTIAVSGMIWFINNNAGACSVSCDGRLSNPYTTLATFNTANVLAGGLNPDNNDNIFIYESATAYTGAVTLRTGQKLIGQDATATLAAITGITPGSASATLPAMNVGAPTSNITSTVTLNTNATVRGLSINSTTSTGVNDPAGAISGVNVSEVIVATTSGTAVLLSSTGGTFSFRSISSNGATNGISLTSTTGSFTVTGDGGGSNNGSGGVIQNSSGPGINLSSANSVSLGYLNVQNGGDDGIRGSTVAGFTLNRSNVTNNGNAVGERGIELLQLSGSGGISNTTVSGSAEANVRVENDTANLTSFNVTGSTFSTTNFTTGDDGFLVLDTGSASMTVSITGCTFTDNKGDHFQAATDADATGPMNIIFNNNTLTTTPANDPNVIGGGITINTSGSTDITFQVNNNNLQQAFDDGININLDPGSLAGASMNGTISGNTIGTSGQAASGSESSNTITVASKGAGTTTINITNNQIFEWGNQYGIFLGISEGSSSMNAAVTGNTLHATFPNVLLINGIRVDAGATGGDSGTLEVTLSGNDVTGEGNAANGDADIRLRQRFGTTIKLPGYAGANNNTTAVNTFVAANNDPAGATPAPTVSSAVSGSGGGFIGGPDLLLAGSAISPQLFKVPALTQKELDFISSAAIERWAVTGLSPQLIVLMRNLRFEISDLSRGHLAEIDGDRIKIDVDAGGYGWFVDLTPANDLEFIGGVGSRSTSSDKDSAGRIDLLTAVEHELGHRLGLLDSYDARDRDSIMYGYLTIGERRSPASGLMAYAVPGLNRNKHFLLFSTEGSAKGLKDDNHRSGGLNATQDKKKPGQIIVSRPLAPSPNAGETISTNIGAIPAGESVTITYQVTVNNPYLGGSNVSNQGTVSGSNFSNVLTDDPAVGGANDPTLTPILLPANISVSDAQANEPPTGSSAMLFIVSLSAPAPAGGTSVHYATADQAPGAGHAVGGTDYTAIPDTVLTFAAGEQVKTVTVNIPSDADAPEPDETFLFNLSNPTNGVIVDGQAVGTIKQGNASGTFLISEIRTSGPAGLGDDFVELYNNTDSPLTVAASDASAGYGVYKMGADCSAAPILIGTIPNGTVIPARGHYLMVGSQYSLANYGGTGAAAADQTLSADIESDRNVAVFSTANVLAVSSGNRLDAVGFGANTGGNCDLLREGSSLPPVSGTTTEHSFQRDICGKGGSAAGGICPGVTPVDTNDNAADFLFADTAGTLIGGVQQRLGAPGPENSTSPLLRNTILANLLDQSVAAASPPNRVRDLTPGPPATSTNGTMSIRRRWTNNTGGNVTRLRFRIIDISSLPSPGAAVADLRAITSVNVGGVSVNDAATCAPAPAPCTITVLGTILEQPPTQANGGALNSTMTAGTITLGTPLANNASISLQFLLGVKQTGTFKFYIIVEALP